MNDFGGNVLNLRLGMDAVGDDAGLRAGERYGRDSDGMQRDGRERDGGLLAGGEEDIHFALIGQGHDFLGELDEVIGDATHGGDDDDDFIALGVIFRDARGDILDAVGVAHRGAAIFLNDQGHNFDELAPTLAPGAPENGSGKIVGLAAFEKDGVTPAKNHLLKRHVKHVKDIT